MRRIVLCLDGTWNSAFAEAKRRDGKTVLKPSNPLKLARAVKQFAADGTEQIVYYAIGVGSLSVYPGTANWLLHQVDRILGGAFGARFEANVEDAVHFLTLNYEPGDEVFVFGFSRGAGTARAVTRFLEWNRGEPSQDLFGGVPAELVSVDPVGVVWLESLIDCGQRRGGARHCDSALHRRSPVLGSAMLDRSANILGEFVELGLRRRVVA